MNIEEFRLIKKVSEVTSLNRDRLGAALMYNIEYEAVTDQHILNFRTHLYYRMKGYGGEYLSIRSPDGAWCSLKTEQPINKEQLAKAREIRERVESKQTRGDTVACSMVNLYEISKANNWGTPPMEVQELNWPVTPTSSFFQKLKNKLGVFFQ